MLQFWVLRRNKLLINPWNCFFSGEGSWGLSGVVSSGSRSRRTGDLWCVRTTISASESYQSAAGWVSTAEANCDVTSRGIGRVEINEHRASEWNRVSGKLKESVLVLHEDGYSLVTVTLGVTTMTTCNFYVCGWNDVNFRMKIYWAVFSCGIVLFIMV